ncbi:MAG: DUF423 domain-containing protein [Rubricoccaceae bacterium]|nr:DUF423 domain-containing protein [Rubricoccaceae bacterium]
MDEKARFVIVLGSVCAALGVAAGAFGAHLLADSISPERLATFKTAVTYHLVHSPAIVLAGLLYLHVPNGLVRFSGWMFFVGIILFSGSLYALVLADLPWLGAITPLGGAAFIAGWAILAAGAWKMEPEGDQENSA